MEHFKTIAFTHKTTELRDIGRLHIQQEDRESRLGELKAGLNLDELLYISTCNRVEFIMVTTSVLDRDFLKRFFQAFNPGWKPKEIAWATDNCRTLVGEKALRHFFYVASSIDSLVVGEREIIKQVREAYDLCNHSNLTGDRLRLLVRMAVETAKSVYTETQVAQRPISVVSLAYRKMREQQMGHPPHIVMIGAGKTNRTMGRYLRKTPYGSLSVYNRSLNKAEELAGFLGGSAHALNKLPDHAGGFDILITCTGSSQPIMSNRTYRQMIGDDRKEKVIVDMAVPSDLEQEVIRKNNIRYIGIDDLRTEARANLEQRQKELERCKVLIDERIAAFRDVLRERKVELSMKEIPQVVKEIRHRAVTEVFNREVSGLDPSSKEVLDKVIDYLEKKYISVPMKMAKDVMLKG